MQKPNFYPIDLTSISPLLRRKLFSFLGMIFVLTVACTTVSKAGSGNLPLDLTTDQIQQRLTGVIIDSTTGEPLVGVTIKVKGEGIGTVTDGEGKFTLDVEGNAILEITFIGYSRKEIQLKNEENITISLSPSSLSLNQVVVTALGIERQKKSLSYDIQKIDQDAFTTVKSSNFVNSLSGRVSGIQVNPSSSGIGGASRVVLRGTKSIGGNNNAFYVIDGIPLVDVNLGKSEGVFGGMVGSEGMADLNPEDIENISVLSGPSAAALYGSQAAQGVILITTKKGAKDGFHIDYSNNTTFSSPFIMPKFQNTYGNDAGEFQSWGNKLGVPSNYDPKDFFNTGKQVVNALSINVGSDKSQTHISGSSLVSEGIIPNNKYNRYNFTFRNNTSFLEDKITTDVSASYVYQEDQNMLSQGQYFNPTVATYLFPRGEDFSGIKYFERYDPARQIATQFWPYSNQGLSIQNPYWTVNRMLFPNKKNRFMFNGAVSYKPIDWITVSARGRIDNSYQELEQKYFASTDPVFGVSSKGYYSDYTSNLQNLYTDFIASLSKSVGQFHLDVNVGGSYQKVLPQIKGLEGKLMTIPNLFALQNIDPSSATPIEGISNTASGGNQYDAWANSAVFGVAELGYEDMLFLTVSGRNDWNSHLVNAVKDNFFYPSVGLSAVLSQMVTLPDFVSYLKVRGSYANVGSPITFFGLTPGTTTYPINSGQIGTLGYPERSDFRPEKTKAYEVGLNLELFDSKLGLDLTLYQSNTFNQLILTAASGTSGFAYRLLQAGNVLNKGLEAYLHYDDRFGDFKYSSGVTFSMNRNKVVEIADHPVSEDGKIEDPILSYVVPGTGNMGRVVKGHSMGEIFTQQILKRDPNGHILINSDGSFERINQEVRLGNTSPKFTLGWRNDFGFKNFKLGLLFFARVGGIVTSQTQALLDAYGVTQKTAQDRDNGGVLVNGTLYDTQSFYSQVGGSDPLLGFYTYDASNLRLQEASFGYELPSSLISDKVKVTVSVIAHNLWMIYNKAPYDPESTPSTGTFYQGYDYFMLPSTRDVGFSLKLQF